MKPEELEALKGDDTSAWRWYTRFAGAYMAHNYYLYHIFSEIMDKNPQIKRIVELGTYKGAMTIVLGLEGIRKQIPVNTFDIEYLITEEVLRMHKCLGINMQMCNIFEKPEVVRELLNEPCFLICDNGNKPKEFEMFVGSLKEGSIVAVHDYGQEFFDSDAAIHEGKVVPYMRDEWEKHNAQLAIYRVIK